MNTRFLTRLAVTAALGGFALVAGAQVAVDEPWVRATVPQQKATGAFMRLTAQRDLRLVQASSPVAGVVEIHEMAMENNVMRMRAIPGLDLPAGKGVELKPGGYHVMLMNLHKPVAAGDTVPITLVVEGKDGKRQSIAINAPARPLTSSMPMSGGQQHRH